MKSAKLFPSARAVLSVTALGCFLLGALSAGAALDNDVFSTVRSLPIGTAGMLTQNLPLTTNGPVDLLGYTGRGQILLTTGTNGAGAATITATIQTSPDTNTWTGLGNFALISSTTAINYTNLFFNTNTVVTDNYLLPFTATTPTASTAGWATPYPAPLLFTNAAGAITVTAKGTYVVGINLTDAPRYLQVVWTVTGVTGTNGNTFVGATLQGNRIYAP
jgi:hypothetical protein